MQERERTGPILNVREKMIKLFCLAAGGTVGTLSRYFFSNAMHHFFGNQFPYGTLSVNLAGCFLIGIFVSMSERFIWDPNLKLLLMAGFCGAFTTFSTFILENVDLLQRGQLVSFAAYIVSSLSIGLVLFYAGFLLPSVLIKN